MSIDRDQERLDRGTAGAGISPPPTLSETRTAAAVLTQDAGFVRYLARDLHDRTDLIHQHSHSVEWADRTRRRSRSAMSETLRALAELGFSWRDLARLVGVSVPAIQKWRRGEGTTGTNRQRVASLLAACDLVTEQYEIQEVASWFEMPVTPEVAVTPIDLWSGGRPDLVIELASGHTEVEQILSSWDPSWRERYSSDFEEFRSDDGHLSLGIRED